MPTRFILIIIGFISSLILSDGVLWAFLLSVLLLGGLLYAHAHAVDQVCMVVRRKPEHLLIGDWLVADVRVAHTLIRATHQGLTAQEIRLLRKAKKSVVIRQGIPFVPVFFLSYLLMVCAVFFEWNLAVIEMLLSW